MFSFRDKIGWPEAETSTLQTTETSHRRDLSTDLNPTDTTIRLVRGNRKLRF